MEKKTESKYRNWCFTAYIEPKIDVNEKITYVIYQKEKCPTSGKFHWQGYIEFKNVMRFSEVKNIFSDNTIHIEPRYGTQKQAIEYCRKSDSQVDKPIEKGIPKNQGNRSELDSLTEGVENGMTAKELLQEFGGRALKNINMIVKALEIQHGFCAIDRLILANRKNGQNASEVEGNTEPSTVAINKVKEEIRFESDGIFENEELEPEEKVKKNIKKLRKRKL